MIFKHLSIAVDNFHNDRRFHQFAAVCKHAVCFCHIPDRHAVGKAAERRRQVRITVFTVSDQGGNPYILCRPDNLFYTHLIRQMDRRYIHGLHKRFHDGYAAAGSASVILWYPAAAEIFRFITKNVERRYFVCKCRQIDKRFESRTRLAGHLHSAVKVILPAAAHHSADVSRSHFYGNKGALRLCQFLIIGIGIRKIFLQGRFRFLLQIKIQRSVNLQALFVYRIGIILFADQVNDIIYKIRRHTIRSPLFLGPGQMDIRFFCRSSLTLGNVPILHHLIKNDGLPLFCRFHTVERRVIIRTVRKTRYKRALGKRQILHVFSKIHFRCRLDTITALSEINLVHIHFQNFFFGILPLYL